MTSPRTRNVPAKLEWMSELLRDGKAVGQAQWQPISADRMELDAKGWFDVDGEVDSSKYGPGVYELRVTVKDATSKKTVQRSAVFGVE